LLFLAVMYDWWNEAVVIGVGTAARVKIVVWKGKSWWMLCHVIATVNFTLGYDAMSKETRAFCGSTQPTSSGCSRLLPLFPLSCSTLFPNLNGLKNRFFLLNHLCFSPMLYFAVIDTTVRVRRSGFSFCARKKYISCYKSSRLGIHSMAISKNVPTYRTNVQSPLPAWFQNPENHGSKFLRNVGNYLPVNMTKHKQKTSIFTSTVVNTSVMNYCAKPLSNFCSFYKLKLFQF
jgi:hypothetical protein